MIVSSVLFLNNLHLEVNFIWNKDPFRRVLLFRVVIDLERERETQRYFLIKEMEIEHFSHEHPLIQTEVLETDGEKGVICSGCKESVLGPGYKCCECNFLLHKSCAELPMEIQHPMHPNHTLTLRTPSGRRYCDACLNICTNCFSYRCHSCNFDLDIKCASQSRIDTDNSHQHVFTHFFKQIPFPCEACGEECKDIASICSTCHFLVHTFCANFPSTVEIAAHNHCLAHTYSLRQVKKLLDKVFCRLCYEKINPNYAAYYCQECDYVAHLFCTYDYNVFQGPLKEGQEAESGFEEINLNGDEEAGEIKHFSHQHNLVLNCEELKDEKLCEGCRLLISGPFYSCEQCSFFLHDRCAKLPTKKKHLLHPHQLTLFSSDQCAFYCDACGQYRPGFSYGCEDCDFFIDVQCCTIPETLKHEGHQHSLYLAIYSEQICNGCHVNQGTGTVFVCTECNFATCFKCASLPLMIKHKYDRHPLKLTYAVDDDSEEYFCVLCEKERDPKYWFYYCTECDFDAHTECVLGRFPYIKWGSTYMYKYYHEHPLTYVRKAKYSPPCKSCGVVSEDCFLECDQCKATIQRWHTCNS